MVLDDGEGRESIWLDSPVKGLLIGNSMWREMLDSSDYYDEADYIRDYDEFKASVSL